LKINPIHATDFYKTGHIRQYPANTTQVYSNLTCRTDTHAKVLDDFDGKTVFFGLQGVCQWLLQDMWTKEFFGRPRSQVLRQYQRRMDRALGEGAVSTKHIGELYDLGYLPIHIKALPEGSRIPIKVPLFTITNTLPKFYWLVNYLETQLSAELWKATTSATTAFEYKRLLTHYARITGAPVEFVPFQGHDFSFRGMSGIHDATQNGAAHLTSFMGTDTITAIDYLEEYYGAREEDIGGSVPATEHSVMCMGGVDDEIATFRRLITELYPAGIVSIVSDTWDFWQVMTEFTRELKCEILARDGKVVFRPDSGDPVKIICGDPEAPIGSPAHKGAVSCLYEVFGGTLTPTGYLTLDSHVGLIYGDSITLERAQAILSGLEAKGFSSANIVLGIGSYTYQYVTRDSFGSAIKATYGVVDGQPRELFKAPKTDSGVKNSAKGLLRIEQDASGEFILHQSQTPEQEAGGLLETVFIDGRLERRQTLRDIRSRLAMAAGELVRRAA
jgi:nicotinamide phosphoribosyltransferase